MYTLGVVIALGAAVVFAVLGILTAWGGWIAIQREVLRGFVSAAPAPAERLLILFLIGVPLCGAALFGIMAALRIMMVAIGQG